MTILTWCFIDRYTYLYLDKYDIPIRMYICTYVAALGTSICIHCTNKARVVPTLERMHIIVIAIQVR